MSKDDGGSQGQGQEPDRGQTQRKAQSKDGSATEVERHGGLLAAQALVEQGVSHVFTLTGGTLQQIILRWAFSALTLAILVQVISLRSLSAANKVTLSHVEEQCSSCLF